MRHLLNENTNCTYVAATTVRCSNVKSSLASVQKGLMFELLINTDMLTYEQLQVSYDKNMYYFFLATQLDFGKLIMKFTYNFPKLIRFLVSTSAYKN